MAYAVSDVRLDHLVHFRIGDQRDRPVYMYTKRSLLKLKRAHELGGVVLLLVQRVVFKHFESIGQPADVPVKIELHIVFEALTLKVGENVIGLCVVGRRTLNAFEIVNNAFCGGGAGFSSRTIESMWS